MQTPQSISGHSFPLNSLFVTLNLLGFAALLIGFLDYFEQFSLLLKIVGAFVVLLSAVLLFIFKGKVMMAVVARISVGSLFIVSGLIKANDTRGFSYKLEEYFQDGALAYRIKEWFGAPSFSLEYFIQYALVLSIAICIVEIVLGVLLIVGGKMRLVSWILVPIMLFFTFLTWHTASCDNKKVFQDRDTYTLSSVEGQSKLEESKKSNKVKVISKTADEIVVDEYKTPQCVTDCGCFGDAMKGSVGRSLTPAESMWKDFVLLYLSIWIFLTQKQHLPNSVRQNWIYIPSSLLLIGGLSWVFDWYLMVLFAVVSLLGSLLITANNRLWSNHYIASLFVIALSSLLVWFTLTLDPIKDYRAYASGNYLPALTKNGKPGVFKTMLIYKNKKTGEQVEYDSESKAYFDSNIWDKTDEWKYVTMITKELVPTRLPSIDTNQFNPTRKVEYLTGIELNLPEIQQQIQKVQIPGLKLNEVGKNQIIEIALEEYHEESYPSERFQVVDTIQLERQSNDEVSIRDFIFSADRLLVLFSNDLKTMDLAQIQKLKELAKAANQAKVPFIMVVNADESSITAFRQKTNLKVPVFVNDGLELKVVARVNPALMVITNGRVKGKYAARSLPTYNWIEKNLFNP